MRCLSLCLVIAVFEPSTGSAATIANFFLDQNSAAGTFQLSVQLSGDPSAGIAVYRIPLRPNQGTTLLTVNHMSPSAPNAQNGALSGSVGFTNLRSPDVGWTFIQGTQDIDPPSATPFILYNYGITAGSFATVQNGPATPVGSSEGDNWLTRPTIATGTFTPGGSLYIDLEPHAGGFVSVFSQVGSLDDIQAVIAVAIPEPIFGRAAGIALVAAVAHAGRRRNLLL